MRGETQALMLSSDRNREEVVPFTVGKAPQGTMILVYGIRKKRW